jgi:hypothetical protein
MANDLIKTPVRIIALENQLLASLKSYSLFAIRHSLLAESLQAGLRFAKSEKRVAPPARQRSGGEERFQRFTAV